MGRTGAASPARRSDGSTGPDGSAGSPSAAGSDGADGSDEAGDPPAGSTEAPAGAAPVGRWRRWVQAALLAVPAVWIAVVGWNHRWMTEDGFIYLRVVKQIEAGNGPVFNAGERVEVSTGTLWMAVLTVADVLLPFRLEWISVAGGIACTAGGVALATVGARRLWGAQEGGTWFVPFGALVFVAVFPVWAFASSGLENGLAFLWLGACLHVLARWASRPAGPLPLSHAVVLGLGWLVRPEMVLYSALFLLAVVAADWRRDHLVRTVRILAAGVAVPLAYQVFRMGYYGSLVPNAAIAKEGSATNLSRGWTYFRDLADPYRLWIAGLGLALGGLLPLAVDVTRTRDRRRAAVVAAMVVGAVVNAGYIVLMGGDYHHGRLLLPALFAVTAPVAVVPVRRRHVAGLVVALWVAFAVVGFRPDQHGGNPLANGTIAPRAFGNVTTDDIGWGEGGEHRAKFAEPDFYMDRGLYFYARPEVTLHPDLELPYAAFWGIGVAGYAMDTDTYVLDMMGLADSFTAHLELLDSRPADALAAFPGHQKPLPSPWLAARVTAPGSRPDPEAFPPLGASLIPTTTGFEYQEQVAWARAALECDAVQDLLEAAGAPLTPRRFLDNIVGSAANTRVRIPPDPEDAYRRFCGAGTPAEVEELRAGRVGPAPGEAVPTRSAPASDAAGSDAG